MLLSVSKIVCEKVTMLLSFFELFLDHGYSGVDDGAVGGIREGREGIGEVAVCGRRVLSQPWDQGSDYLEEKKDATEF